MDVDSHSQDAIKQEIADLEEKLRIARQRLNLSDSLKQDDGDGFPTVKASDESRREETSSLHILLLLADSALPLGSFAFSSGLESCLAHNKRSAKAQTPKIVFDQFLILSIQSLATTALPYVLAAYKDPSALSTLDNDFDASTPCTVARRASLAQGKALLSVWERSYKESHGKSEDALHHFSISLRNGKDTSMLFPCSGHLSPLWGAVTRAMAVDIQTAAYLFLFSHARTIVSAAVRASVLGPYQAQTVLANPGLKSHIETLMEQNWNVDTAQAGQSVPAIDIWMGRHELLYSRIFNS